MMKIIKTCNGNGEISLNEAVFFQPDNFKYITDENLQKIKDSIIKHGITFPLYRWKNKNVIVDGHHRIKALRELEDQGYKIDKLPVIDVNAKDEKELSEKLLLLNSKYARITEEGFYDFLATFDLKLEDIDFEIDIPELDLVLEEEVDEEKEAIEDDVPKVPEEPKSKLGDIYQLGEHRLMCGDSTKIEDVEKLMNGEKAVLGFNDPPYGMKKEKDGVKNDNLNYDDLLEFNKKWVNLQFDFLEDNGSFYCWGIDEPLMDIYSDILKPMIKTQKATFRNLITWDKGYGQGQMSEEFRSYSNANEKCLFVMCGVQGFNNNADNYFEGWDSIVNYLDSEKNKAGLTIKDCKRLAGHSEKSGCHWFDKSQWMIPTEETYKSWKTYCQQNNIDAFKKEYDELKKEYDELKKEYDELKKKYYSTRAYFDNTHDNMNNVWHFARTNNEERELTGGHVTPKPIKLCERAIKSSCNENGIVIDVFGGSGSTLIACEKTNRKCYMMELDPKYIDVIIERWENYTGNKSIKVN